MSSASSLKTLIAICVFVTGTSGIVAEYTMATMASYLLGNAVFQWTATISLMLFMMGIGSYYSKKVVSPLKTFILCELGLSFTTASCAVVAYLSAAFIDPTLIIYGIACSIGFFIGMEIPLATRINSEYDELKINISKIMEYDYLGALLGGLIFAFIALPFLGLTYTPIVLGTINFVVALALMKPYYRHAKHTRLMSTGVAASAIALVCLAFSAKSVILYGEQQNYVDKVIYQEQTPYQKIVLTQWKNDYWLYLNGSEQFSSYDEEQYHEPLVHPVVNAAPKKENVLILGGGDGLAVRELLRYKSVRNITVVDLDPAVTELANTHPVLTELNNHSLKDPRVKVLNKDAFIFLNNTQEIYDSVIIDLPDPKNIDLSRLYSRQFYRAVNKVLTPGGTMITQASSVFFSKESFLCILKTVRAANFTALPMHHHIPTFGEWGWVIASKGPLTEKQFKQGLMDLEFKNELRFLNNEAMIGMLQFGKQFYEEFKTVEVNDEHNLILHRYYNNSKEWELY